MAETAEQRRYADLTKFYFRWRMKYPKGQYQDYYKRYRKAGGKRTITKVTGR